MFGFHNQVTFDHLNPNHEASTDARKDLGHLNYAPLKRVTGRSFCMGLLVSMGGLIFGYDTGQISGFQEMPDFLRRFGERQSDGTYAFSNLRSGLIVGLLSIGTLVGALVAAPVADRLGRRPSISIWSIVVSVGFVIQIASSVSWQQFMIGRLVAGFGVGALSLLVPMFQAETAPPWIRGALVCTYQLFITLGIFLAACFNYGTYSGQRYSSASWRIVIGLGWLWTLILGLGVWFFKETPRYVYRKGRVQEAKHTLMHVYGASENHIAIFTQMEELESKWRIEMQTKKESFVQEFVGMFRGPRMTYRILLGMGLQMFQQLTGANFFFYFGVTIFSSVSISSFITQLILNAINFGCTFIGLYLIERYGRRKSLIVGSCGMTVCFVVFASVGHFALNVNTPTATPQAGVALIVMAALFIVFYSTTWGPMVWSIIAELYPSKYRARAMAMATASNWTWNFLIAFFTPFITSDIDFAFGYVFAGCNVIGGLLVYFFVIEGQGRTLEEIDTMYLEHVPPRKSASWEPPSAEEMARIRAEAGTEDVLPNPSGTNGQSPAVNGAGRGKDGYANDAEHKEAV
ncbi:general substrate transporter [Coniella lustricola]|uniref:General substrate transporter n=1 Tax=Coniella lustricola TaxID=2025994 RepID=A0A2T3AAI9_9PEZI|nr:general substrate transporter [Coniella lustricola]